MTTTITPLQAEIATLDGIQLVLRNANGDWSKEKFDAAFNSLRSRSYLLHRSNLLGSGIRHSSLSSALGEYVANDDFLAMSVEVKTDDGVKADQVVLLSRPGWV